MISAVNQYQAPTVPSLAPAPDCTQTPLFYFHRVSVAMATSRAFILLLQIKIPPCHPPVLTLELHSNYSAQNFPLVCFYSELFSTSEKVLRVTQTNFLEKIFVNNFGK